MIELRPILFIVGILLAVLALTMLLPALADLAAGHPDWKVFVSVALLTLFPGGALAFANRGPVAGITVRQAFLLTTVAWIVIAAFAAIPFVVSELELDYTDAFFEAMSGITTTGSTVIAGLDAAPPGILLWRALLQWLGGVGIIVMAIAILPMLRVGGMQLFRMESSDASEKVLPRATQIAAATIVVYVALTMVCASALWIAGMSAFEAVAVKASRSKRGFVARRYGQFPPRRQVKNGSSEGWRRNHLSRTAVAAAEVVAPRFNATGSGRPIAPPS